MLKKTKRMIFTMIILIIVITTICIVATRNHIDNQNVIEEKNYIELNNGTKQNISYEISKDRKFDELDISNVKIFYKDEICHMNFLIKNNTEMVKGDFMAKIKILDKDKNVITNLTAYIAEILPGNTTEATIDSKLDFSNAYDYEIYK